MAYEIPTWYAKQYSKNIQQLSQQRGSRFRPCVRVEPVAGGQYSFFDQLDQATASKRTSRYADTVWNIPTHARRRISHIPIDIAIPIDNMDKLALVTDPTSSYVISCVNALGRAIDDEIIAAATGTAYTGVEGGTSTSFDANMVVDAGAATLDLADIAKAKELLDAAEVDENIPRYFATSAKQLSALLQIEQISSADYNTVKALVRGEIDTYMGFKWIRSERLTGHATATQFSLAWAQDGLLLGVGEEINTDIGIRRDKNNIVQIFCTVDIGATRMEEAKVVKVISKDN